MTTLSEETQALAERLATAQCRPVDEVIRQALEEQAKAVGILTAVRPPRRRQNVEEMLAVGKDIAAMPLLDPRSPLEIMDDLNTL